MMISFQLNKKFSLDRRFVVLGLVYIIILKNKVVVLVVLRIVSETYKYI